MKLDRAGNRLGRSALRMRIVRYDLARHDLWVLYHLRNLQYRTAGHACFAQLFNPVVAAPRTQSPGQQLAQGITVFDPLRRCRKTWIIGNFRQLEYFKQLEPAFVSRRRAEGRSSRLLLQRPRMGYRSDIQCPWVSG